MLLFKFVSNLIQNDNNIVILIFTSFITGLLYFMAEFDNKKNNFVHNLAISIDALLLRGILCFLSYLLCVECQTLIEYFGISLLFSFCGSMFGYISFFWFKNYPMVFILTMMNVMFYYKK